MLGKNAAQQVKARITRILATDPECQRHLTDACKTKGCDCDGLPYARSIAFVALKQEIYPLG